MEAIIDYEEETLATLCKSGDNFAVLAKMFCRWSCIVFCKRKRILPVFRHTEKAIYKNILSWVSGGQISFSFDTVKEVFSLKMMDITEKNSY